MPGGKSQIPRAEPDPPAEARSGAEARSRAWDSYNIQPNADRLIDEYNRCNGLCETCKLAEMIPGYSTTICWVISKSYFYAINNQ